MTDAEKLEKLKSMFVQKVVNACSAVERVPEKYSLSGQEEKCPRLYRRDDLTTWAKEAFDRGEDVFYVEPVDKNNPNGALRLSEPRHEYVMATGALTQEEYEELFGEYEFEKVPGDYRTVLSNLRSKVQNVTETEVER